MGSFFPSVNRVLNSGVISPTGSFSEIGKGLGKSLKKGLDDEKLRIAKRYDARINKIKNTFGANSEELKASPEYQFSSLEFTSIPKDKPNSKSHFPLPILAIKGNSI